MQTIWKYELDIDDTQKIKLPRYSKILTVQVQRGVPCLWALVLKDETVMVTVTIHTFGTGHDVPEFTSDLVYVGTYQLIEGAFIGHVFREKK